jgi:hypothetical protein
MVTPVGTIRGVLELESAAFIRELRRASAETARNTNAMKRSMASMQASFARAGSALKGALAGFASLATVHSMVRVGRAAIEMGDEIGEAATKIGISAGELQRLRFAAQQADVDIGQLDGALKVFQKSIAKGDIANQPFAAFIQQIREAETHLEKVAIAQAGLGKQFQVGILLAAQSGAEFKKFYSEAFVLSEQAVRSAGNLDNQIRSVQQAVAVGFSQGFLEAFNTQLGTSHQSLVAINTAAQALGGLLAGIAISIGNAISAATSAINSIKSVWDSLPEAVKAVVMVGMRIGNPIGGAFSAGSYLFGDGGATSGNPGGGAGGGRNSFGVIAAEMKKIGDAAAAATPKVGEFTTEVNKAAAAAPVMGQMHQMTANQITMGWLDVAGTVGGALQTLFGENKAVAIAMAVINTAQAITAALAQYPPPLSFAMAAAQAAAGAAQIAVIASSKPGNSRAPSVKGGGGGGKGRSSGEKSVASGGAGAGGLQTSITLNITGDVFGPEHFRKMVKGINGVVQDGTVMFRSK